MADKVAEAMKEVVKETGLARTTAVTLQGLDYADHLSDAIKKHADGVETLYSQVQVALKSSAGDKELGRKLKEIEEKAQATKKLQAS